MILKLAIKIVLIFSCITYSHADEVQNMQEIINIWKAPSDEKIEKEAADINDFIYTGQDISTEANSFLNNATKNPKSSFSVNEKFFIDGDVNDDLIGRGRMSVLNDNFTTHMCTTDQLKTTPLFKTHCSKELVDYKIQEIPAQYKTVEEQRCEINYMCAHYSKYYDKNKQLPPGMSMYEKEGKKFITILADRRNLNNAETYNNEIQKHYLDMNKQINNPNCPSLCRVHYTKEEIVKPASFKLIDKVYKDYCTEYSNNKYCKFIEKTCLDRDTREISGQVFSRCWNTQATYECKFTNQCDHYINNSKCEQISSKCLDKKKDADDNAICTKWQQEYKCFSDEVKYTDTEIDFKGFTCMDGSCGGTDDEENSDDMPDTIAKFDILNQILQQYRDKQVTGQTKLPDVFTGHYRTCKRSMLKNCCKFSGIGYKLGLQSCSQGEKELAEKRRAGVCQMVLKKKGKQGFCCFDSKLALLIHQQGREKLGKKWMPCEGVGFTIEEFARLNLSEMDLRAAFVIHQKNLIKSLKAEDMQADIVDKMQKHYSDYHGGEHE